MKIFYRYALIFTLLFLVSPAFAQMGPFLPKAEGSTIKDEDIQKLIQTLENSKDRDALISNLKILLEEQSKQEQATHQDMMPRITEQLGVRGHITDWVTKYESFLDDNAISSSFIHQSLGTLITLIIGISLFLMVRKIAMKIIHTINHFSEKHGLKLSRITFYTRVLNTILKFLIIGVMAYTIAKIWDLQNVVMVFESAGMRSFLTSAMTVLLVSVLAAVIWEAVGIYLSYILKQADDKNQTRIKTLLPLIRNIVLSVFGLLFALVIMSEMGLNVAPFLAGAGVIGVAIGFGAQSMVKDFLTGFTIVLEDIIRVGDVVSLSGCTGVVEKITLRKIQLRDFAGIVYTIPFSQITTIQNMTKNFSYYPLEIGVAYKESIDQVMQIMRRIDTEMRSEQTYETMMLEPIDIVGVERFEDNAVIIKARMKTAPIKQWDVGREYNRRLKMAFDTEGIEMPFPQRVITIKNEKE
jgi:moderate conductance mechanosensitive channel